MLLHAFAARIQVQRALYEVVAQGRLHARFGVEPRFLRHVTCIDVQRIGRLPCERRAYAPHILGVDVLAGKGRVAWNDQSAVGRAEAGAVVVGRRRRDDIVNEARDVILVRNQPAGKLSTDDRKVDHTFEVLAAVARMSSRPTARGGVDLEVVQVGSVGYNPQHAGQ